MTKKKALTNKQKKLLAEQAKIELARRSFKHFCEYLFPEIFDVERPHIDLIQEAFQEAFEKFERGEKAKILIAMPPRYFKSFMTSLFSAWCLGKHPDKSVMRNTYGADLAQDFSYFVRDLMRHERFLKVFPHITLRKDRQKIDAWSLEGASRPSYICAGVGGAITGKGATMLSILDDPIKNMQDGLSSTIRKTTWEWYGSTHKTRIEGNAIEIVVATRWHTEDPTGRLIELEGEVWEQIIIPALVRDSEGNMVSSCPTIRSTEEFMEFKKVIDDFIWDALYMQQPANIEGVLFKKSELKTFNMAKFKALQTNHETELIAGYTDVADTGSDSLASIIGYLINDKVYIVDVVFTTDPIEVTEPLVTAQILSHSPNLHVIESNNGGRSFARNVKTAILLEGSYTQVKAVHTTQNKETRILMKSGQIKEFFVFRDDYEVGSDYDRFMREFTTYVKLGNNEHDDAVDAATGLAETLFEGQLGRARRLDKIMNG